jgi:crossover junction endodeoxyribonuclease RusA
MTISLPFPPSANRLWRAGRGRIYLAARYKAWQKEAGWLLQSQRPQKHDGPVSIKIELTPPDKRRRDPDNRVKPLLDLLTAHQVIKDDSTDIVRVISVELDTDGEPGARIEIVSHQ